MMSVRTSRALLAACAAAFLLPAATAIGEEAVDVKASYTKYEFLIPMRDGVRLFTAVYVPKDRSRVYPIMLNRTPYGVAPYGPDAYRAALGPSPRFSDDGFIFAYQDVRGRYMSEGEYVNMRPHLAIKTDANEIDESTDTYDTIDWLLKNVGGHNGKVGQWGISYPGFYTSMGMIDAHPALKASSPQAPIADWFAGDDWHHNGALFLAHAFNFMSSFGHPRPAPVKKNAFDRTMYNDKPDGYAFFLGLGPLANADARYYKGDVPFWNEMMKHADYDDFWKARNIRPHLKNIKPAVLNVGGWYDAENLYGPLETYRAVEASSPKATNVLVMGPWSHGSWSGGDGASLGPIAFHSNTAEYYRDQIEFPFFQTILKGGDGPAALPEARVFETGTNQWRTFDAWPPKAAKPKTLYLAAGGGVAFSPPESAASPSFDEYVSDPAKPVPFIDAVSNRMTGDYMIQDQRFASRRPDVLVYQTGPLAEDLTLVGPIQVKIHVSTSGGDSDWVVKLVDVFPDDHAGETTAGTPLASFQGLVRGDVMRGRYRNSLSAPEPFVPNQPTAVNFTMQDVDHTFRSGHRLMIQVQSTWFPLVDRNPQKYVDVYAAKPEDFQKAVQRVFHEPAAPSRLEVLELPR
ncbi:CocE/NonD family hydrolase [Paludisphaera mucosa]|uniref:CocE/NonD family hydrolase n=1 Tax=Paludisphaera mucosa TaxID=3030827 RepID=A0ABT6FAA4_9BACT|nr:CocE/NonD family hydrolase [Paludisphaera mucosa]MDG3004523.1 CocE/NonD family hydrolase [Paludisphaera mucosa]